MASRGDDPPAGWTASDNVLRPGSRVCDFAARGQTLIGVCSAQDCRRRTTLAPDALLRIGAPGLDMARVKRLWACQRLDGCSMSWHNEPPTNPLRLGHCRGKPYVRLKVRCRGNGCRYYRVYRAEEMIEGLRKRGVGDADAEIFTLGARMTSGCPLCKKANWTVDVLWLNTDTTGWKQIGERWFDEIAARSAVD